MKHIRVLISTVVLLAIFASQSIACTGKTITIARTESLQQEILAKMLLVLISDRTGTTIKEVIYPTAEEVHAAVVSHDADLSIEYTGVIRDGMLNNSVIADPDELYEAVKEAYLHVKPKNMWILPPFGFNNEELAPEGSVAQGAVVMRADLDGKFPALDNLIMKLSGLIDDAAMQELEDRAANEEIRTVVRDFLSDNRLLF